MDELTKLKLEVLESRKRYLDSVRNLTTVQGSFKPEENVWSPAEITEHLYHAEVGGIAGMWKALEGARAVNPTWKQVHFNKGLTIEQVIEKTWQPKEKVPEGAGPRMFGPIQFWVNALESCQFMLDNLADNLKGEHLEILIYPHPISGPLDIRQRFEFLRFHMDRHRLQVENLKQNPAFPDRTKAK